MHKRILICLDRNQFEVFDYRQDSIAAQQDIGNNSGNGVFQFSLQSQFANLGNYVEINTFLIHNKDKGILDSEYDYINNNFDCIVFSPANIIATYAKKAELIYWKNNFSKIKKPIYGFGLGAQSNIGFSMDYLSEIRNEAIDFIKTILKTGGYIGTRGFFSSECLKKLGFVEYSDFETIGCPSIFLKGANLNINKNKNINRKDFTPLVNGFRAFNSNEFFDNNFKKYKNSYFVCQDEFYKLLYKQEELTWKEYQYLYDKNDKFLTLYKDDRVKLYCTFQEWYKEILQRKTDFAYGCRVHGNILPILVGVPAFIDIFDSRTKELAEYFDIPHAQVDNNNIDLFELYEKLDYSIFNKKFKEKYDIYKNFLNKCGLENNTQPNNLEIDNKYSDRNNTYQNLLRKQKEFKKIVFVAHEFGLYKGHGGIASYLYNITSWLVKNTSHKVFVLAACIDQNCDLLANEKFEIRNIFGDINQQRSQVYDFCKNLNPDYVEFADYLALGLKCIKAKLNNNEFKNTLLVTNNHTATRECWEWSNAKNFALAPNYIQFAYFEEAMQLLYSDVCISPSSFLANYVKEHYTLKKNVLVFANPYFKKLEMKQDIINRINKKIDLSLYSDSFNIVLITRFEGRKHQDRLIDAVIKLNQSGKKVRCFLAGNTSFFGNDNKDYRLYLYENLKEEYKKYFAFYDFLTLEQQEKLIAIADLAVMPSTYENQPVAMVETVLRGIPVMASITSGITDYSKDDCLLFDPSKENLSEQISKYMDKSVEERENIRFRQYDNLCKFLSPEQCIMKRLDLIKMKGNE